MHILVDIGNTNILFGKFDNLDLVEQLRIETEVFDKDLSSVDSETYKKINNFIAVSYTHLTLPTIYSV